MAKVRDAKALMAHIGRLKYGAERFQRMASEGRSRAAKARKAGKTPRKTFRTGGGATFEAGVEMIRAGKTNKLRKLLSAKTAKARARAAR